MGSTPSMWAFLLAIAYGLKGAMVTTTSIPFPSTIPSLTASTATSLPSSTTPPFSPSPTPNIYPATTTFLTASTATSLPSSTTPPFSPSPTPNIYSTTTPSLAKLTSASLPSSTTSSSLLAITSFISDASSTNISQSTPRYKRNEPNEYQRANTTMGKINVKITSGNMIDVSWDSLQCNESYVVDVSCERHHNCCGPCASQITKTTELHMNFSVIPGTNYTVKVRADVCNSSWSEETISISNTEWSCKLNKNFLDNFVLDWEDPCITGIQFEKFVAHSYPLQEDTLRKKRFKVVSTIKNCWNNVTVNELIPYTNYTVTISDKEEKNNCSMNFTTPPAAPTMPTNLKVTQPAFDNPTKQSRIARITWNAPPKKNGKLKSYTLTYHVNNNERNTTVIQDKECRRSCNYKLELKPESNYRFSVTAENDKPEGEKSPPATYSMTTKTGKPFFISTPLIVQKDKVTHKSITLVLNGSSISNINGKITSCTVKRRHGCGIYKTTSPSSVYCTNSSNDTEIFITVEEDNPTISNCIAIAAIQQQDCYTFYVEIATKGHDAVTSKNIYVHTKTDPMLILLYVILGILVILVLATIVLYINYRQRFMPIKPSDSFELPLVVPSPPDVSVERRILLSDLRATVEDLFSRGSAGLSKEYAELKSLRTLKPCSNALIYINKNKTRYFNILPFDETRVVLKEYPKFPCSDFINASYIHGYTVAKEFIASQGPLNNTVGDFWRMVWEKNIYVIVMVTKCIERNKEKCSKYWPDANKSFSFDEITLKVRNMREQEYPQDGYIHRNLQLSKRQKQRLIHQFHFVTWPDMGCPATPDQLINFVKIVKDTVPTNSSHVLVHCSAGVGRSGTFIGLSNLIEEMHDQTSIDVFHTVYRMRLHRTNMVQTEVQYSFLYKCVLKYYLDKTGQSQCWSDIERRLENTDVIPDVINGALGGPKHASIVAVDTTYSTISEESDTSEEADSA